MGGTIVNFQIFKLNFKKMMKKPILDFEIEPLDTSDWGEDFNRKTEEYIKELGILLANKRQWK